MTALARQKYPVAFWMLVLLFSVGKKNPCFHFDLVSQGGDCEKLGSLVVDPYGISIAFLLCSVVHTKACVLCCLFTVGSSILQ